MYLIMVAFSFKQYKPNIEMVEAIAAGRADWMVARIAMVYARDAEIAWEIWEKIE